ncbi:MAG TPA: hypothetical protein VIN58_01945 [Roseateles sp.]
MHPLLATATPKELALIAGLDYGQDIREHLDALECLVFERQCKFRAGEHWFPYEVIELGTNSVKPGHEREFALCCLLALEAINSGFDPAHDRESKFSSIEPHLSQLPEALATLLEAYAG